MSLSHQIQTPDWVKHAVFYQIFPDRFAHGPMDSHPQPSQFPTNLFQNNLNYLHLEPWGSAPTPQGYKGGNFWAMIPRLDYLQDLGITALYFTPIFQATANHRYHTHDYFQVDPLLGGNEAFLAFLEAAHQRQIKVVLDGVFNHCGRGFFYFNDILENGPHSPWVDWFKIEDWPLSAYDGDRPANYGSWVNNRALPVFNHDHPQVREYIMAIGEYWLRQGIDGWRLDVPFEITTPGFWQEFRQRVKGINPQAYIVGEVWTDSRQWLDGTQFDGVMNYLFTVPTIAFTAGDRVDSSHLTSPEFWPAPAMAAQTYGKKIQALLQLYPWEIQLTQLNLLNSHDTARLLTIVGGDRPSCLLAALLLFTFPGAPSVYYGDEVGLAGAMDPDSRRCFPESDRWDTELYQAYKTLIGLRHQYPALRIGQYQILVAEHDVYCFQRTHGPESLIVAVNVGTTPSDRPIPLDAQRAHGWVCVYGAGTIEAVNGHQGRLTLPPRQGAIFAEASRGYTDLSQDR